MLQVVQYQKTGQMLVEELPAPACIKGGILVRNIYSLISAGTEKTSVTTAQSSLIQRARKQPEQVRIVIDTIKKEGLMSTIKKVQSKLDSYKNLGYSTAGVVIESLCDEFKPGDMVACAGAGFAVHAEIVSVPKNLAVKIPDGVLPEEAAYTTLGSIAMQGVRQADMRLGENVAVIGLGLLGQITVQLLKASGCKVAGMDINPSLFASALKYGADAVYPSSREHIKSMKAFAGGIGFDAVIITASANSNQPLELALDLARKKGKVVVVGGVQMNVPRSPFYEKEIDLKISCSYGPGRYDADYEIRGNDYPAAYVRWTENRNMQAFIGLIAEKKMDVRSMTTHVYDIKDASKAYDLITGKINEPYVGILLKYPERKDALNRTIQLNGAHHGKGEVKLGFVGAGAFAQSYLLPPLKDTGIEFTGVSTATSVNAQTAARQFGFRLSSTDSSELIRNKDVNLVFCATQHDTHARYVIESLRAGKPVFVEKPLCASRQELLEIDKAVSETNGRVMVGFNRRFSKPFEAIKEFFANRRDPMIISYRVNAGTLPRTHWVFAPEQGMGRIVGEACHFIDCMFYLTGAMPVKVYAEAITGTNPEAVNNENVVITIKFSDGSVGTLQYLSNGEPSLPKEYCEVFCENSVAVMNNFSSVDLVRGGKTKKLSFDGKKGHREEAFATVKAIKDGRPMPISYDELRAVTLVTFAALDSLANGQAVFF